MPEKEKKLKCNFSRERYELAKTWLGKINEVYSIPEDIVESYTEYYLIICRSISDYLFMDFLTTIKPEISMGDKAEIIRNKKRHLAGEQIKHQEYAKISQFLKIHSQKVNDLESELLIRYFVALRNWAVHSIMPTIFTNEYAKDMKVIKRRFQKDFVYPLATAQGDRLVLEDGSGFIISEDSGKDSLFDKFPLNELKQTERKQLEKILDDTEAFNLLQQYLDKNNDFITYFEKND